MSERVLLTGATGYVGGRLRRILEENQTPVRCLVRRPDEWRGRVAASTQIVGGDVLDADSVERAMDGVSVAYYLVHSMGGAEDFAESDRKAARIFASAAAKAGIRRIIYLGGLGSSGEGGLSPHLASRHEVGEILRAGEAQTIELRSSILLGSGSLSFELIRTLVDRLPIMTTPTWVRVETQPIAIEDVLQYLQRARTLEVEGSQVYEIGGPERVSYGDLMREYARQRKLTRTIIPLPVLSPRLSSLWLGLITPLYARIGRELIDGVRNETVVQNPIPDELFGIRPRSVEQAIRRALANEDRKFAETRWCDALSSSDRRAGFGGHVLGSRIVDSREIRVAASPDDAFRPIERIGGDRGWYCCNWLWRLRGALDLLVGGVGLRRGRRDPERIHVGEPLDFWRVEAREPGRLLRLRAEMKVPGRAWLQFEVEPSGEGSRVRQTALFKPRGLSGLAYWYALYPLHAVIFSGMLRAIGRRAVTGA